MVFVVTKGNILLFSTNIIIIPYGNKCIKEKTLLIYTVVKFCPILMKEIELLFSFMLFMGYAPNQFPKVHCNAKYVPIYLVI